MNLSQDMQCLGRDLKPGVPEHTKLLTTMPYAASGSSFALHLAAE
jgi:hypothetical protein